MYAIVKDNEIIGYRSEAPNVTQATLAWGKPRILPIVIENEEYNSISQVRTGPELIIENDKVRKVYTIRNKNEDEILAMKTEKILAIKAEAQRRILEIMPSYQQTNWIAKGLEMCMLYGSDPSGWPEQQQLVASIVLPKWTQIEIIRAKSDEIEQNVLKFSNPIDIYTFNIMEGWD